MGGLAMRAPVLTAMFLILTLATLAMPGSANFIGEFYILNGLFDEKIVYAVVAMAGVALAAFYALRMYQRTMHNRLPTGLKSREISVGDGARGRAAGGRDRRPRALPRASSSSAARRACRTSSAPSLSRRMRSSRG